MGERFGIEKPANDNSEVMAEKERRGTYNRIGELRDYIDGRGVKNEMKTELLIDLKRIMNELFDRTLSPSEARRLTKEIAERNGFPFDDSRPTK
jgi:hypothetical protein